jgi:polysaccharide biosynthesis protein PslL
MSQKRLLYIDIAKGLGILLVALAHNDLADYAPFLYHWIYSFHMPLFFFLSGLFFKPEGGLIDLLRRRFDSLLKPYFFSIFLIYFGAIFFNTMGLPTAFGRILKAFYANGYSLDWVAMWFLPALFTVNLFAFLFYLAFRWSKNAWPRWIGLLVVLVIGAWTVNWFNPLKINLLGRNLALNGLPWSIDLALLAGFFFILGREVYRHVPQDWFTSIWMLLGAAAVNLGLNLFFPETMDLNTRAYASPVVFTLEAISGILLILAISRWLERGPGWLSGFFAYMGRISVLILIFHNPVQSYLTSKIDFVIGGSIYSPLITYPFSIAIPVLIYELGVKPNSIVSGLFGMKEK